MWRLLSIVALSIVGVGSALAADLPQPAPAVAPAVYVPTVAPVYNWGGIYFGGQGGWAFGDSDWTIPGGGVIPNASTGNFNINGYVFGATLGFNLQSDAFVFGVETDFDAMGMKGSSSRCAPTACQTEDTWLATVRGRVGYAADRVLFYATAGGAFGNILANTNNTTSYATETKAGWTAGAGIEAALSENWTARVEYLFVDLSNASFTLPAGGPATVKFDANLIRVGVDFKFR
jgi:outer membrane immunogenic protein